MSDRRLTPFSGRVAHESLRGQIEAPAFTAGEAASLIAPVADPAALERAAVEVSLDNLMTIPFVAAAVEVGELSLHGLLHDIRDGQLWSLDGKGGFVSI